MKNLESVKKALNFAGMFRKSVVAFIILAVFLLLIAAGQLVFFLEMFGWFQHQVRSLTGTDVLIANGITAVLMAVIFTLPLWALLVSFLPVPQGNKKMYRSSVFVIFAVLSLASYLFSQDVFFDAGTGEPLKYYAVRPDGQYKFYSTRGYDALTGDTLKGVTKDVIARYLDQVHQGEKETALGVRKQAAVTGVEAFVSTYSGTVTNVTSGTIFFLIAPRQNAWKVDDFTIVRVLPKGGSLNLKLSEGTHYFVLLDADGKNMDWLAYYDFTRDTTMTHILPHQASVLTYKYKERGAFIWSGWQESSFVVEINGQKCDVSDFCSVHIGPSGGWAMVINKGGIFFTP